MGVLKFLLPSNDLARRLAGFRKAYITGLDRTPGRLSVEFRNGPDVVPSRDQRERPAVRPLAGRRVTARRSSARPPWPSGPRRTCWPSSSPAASSTTCGTSSPTGCRWACAVPARARSGRWPRRRRRSSGRRPRATIPRAACAAAQASLEASSRGRRPPDRGVHRPGPPDPPGGDRQARRPSWAACSTGEPDKVPGSEQWPSAFNACQVGVSWKHSPPRRGKYRWELLDAQLAWCRRHKLAIQAGPLLEFRPSALPDWIWLWEGDFETISGFVTDFVRQAVPRYRGKIPLWHLVHRPASQRDPRPLRGGADPDHRPGHPGRPARPTPRPSSRIGVDRPWAEWMSSSHFQLGPAPPGRLPAPVRPRASPASPWRSRRGSRPPAATSATCSSSRELLDLYALLNLPLHLTGGVPVGRPGPTRRPTPRSGSRLRSGPRPPTRRCRPPGARRWLALAVAKPFVRSVTWLQASDAAPPLSPRRAVPRRRQPQAPLRVAAIAPAGCHRMRTRCLRGGRSLYSLVRYPR